MAVLTRDDGAVVPEGSTCAWGSGAGGADGPLPVQGRVVRRCGGCDFWLGAGAGVPSGRPATGFCHRRAPVPSGVWSAWPQTKPSDWCGDFEALKGGG